MSDWEGWEGPNYPTSDAGGEHDLNATLDTANYDYEDVFDDGDDLADPDGVTGEEYACALGQGPAKGTPISPPKHKPISPPKHPPISPPMRAGIPKPPKRRRRKHK